LQVGIEIAIEMRLLIEVGWAGGKEADGLR
jgi:hypothetical protein